jgi:hypothetical protein
MDGLSWVLGAGRKPWKAKTAQSKKWAENITGWAGSVGSVGSAGQAYEKED